MLPRDKEGLEERLQLIVDELGFIPHRELLSKVPYWNSLLQQIDSCLGGLENCNVSTRERYVDFPSLDQLNTIAAIARKEKVLIDDEPGGRKTAPAILAKYAIEQQTGKKLKTIVVCPGYIIPHWLNKLEEYTEEKPKVVVISSDNKAYALRRAANPDTDFIIISYDMIYREFNANGISTQEIENRARKIFGELNSPQEAYDRLRSLTEKEIEENSPLFEICSKIAHEELKIKRYNERQKIIDTLIDIVSDKGKAEFYTIFDEFQAAKNPDITRPIAGSFWKLGQASKYIALLSGTPIPDDLDDIANAMSVLYNEQFPTPSAFTQALLRDQTLLRKCLDMFEKRPVVKLSDISDVKISSAIRVYDATEEIDESLKIKFDLSPLEQEVYYRVLINPEFEAREKLILLRYCTLDAKKLLYVYKEAKAGKVTNGDNTETELKPLAKKIVSFFESNPDLEEMIEGIESTRYAELCSLVKSIVESGEKVVIYTKYTTHVTDKLESMLSEFGVCKADQTVSAKSKEIRLTEEEKKKLAEKGFLSEQTYRSDLSKEEKELLQIRNIDLYEISDRDKEIFTFQTNPDKQVMVASYGTLREGRSLVSANNVAFLDLEYSPGTLLQALRRVARPGQKKKTFVYSLQARGTVDEGVQTHILEKSVVITNSLQGKRITRQERKEISGAPHESINIKGYLSPSNKYAAASLYLARLMSGQMIDRSFEFIKKMLEHSNNAKFFAENYNQNWEYSYSAQSARLLKKIIEGIESKIGSKFSKPIDLACGPAVVSRALGRSMTCVDINPWQLAFGEQECDEINKSFNGTVSIQNKYIKSSIHDIREGDTRYDNKHDLAICSLALDWASKEEGREQIIREINRITDENGYVVITLSRNVIADDDSGRGRFEHAIEDLGFEVDKDITGFYQATRTRDALSGTYKDSSNFTVYVLVAKKKESSDSKNCSPNSFVLNPGFYYTDGKRRILKNGISSECQENQHPEECVEFKKVGDDRKLEEILGSNGTKMSEDDIYTGLKNIAEGPYGDILKRIKDIVGEGNE